MKDFRCTNCNKLLGKIEGKAEIQCPRCKEINFGITDISQLDITTVERIPVKKIGKQITYI